MTILKSLEGNPMFHSLIERIRIARENNRIAYEKRERITELKNKRVYLYRKFKATNSSKLKLKIFGEISDINSEIKRLSNQ